MNLSGSFEMVQGVCKLTSYTFNNQLLGHKPMLYGYECTDRRMNTLHTRNIRDLKAVCRKNGNM
jgi:hypothetical protein